MCSCACSACTPPLLAGVCGVAVGDGARVSAAPRHSWLGCWGVRVGVRAPPVPRHSWRGCAVWACELGLGFRLRPATPGWGVGVCVCWCRRSPCTLPLLAGACGVGVCAWFVFGLLPATPGWSVGLFVCSCACLPTYPATPGWGVRCWCVCLGSGFGCAPPLLAGVLGCLCSRVRTPLVPRHSWLGCAVWVWVVGLGFRVRPATPGWSVGVCVFVCVLPLYPATPGWGVRRACVCLVSGLGCAPPLLAGVLGCVCGGVGAPLVPRHSWMGCAVRVWVFGLGVRPRAATPGWGVGLCVLVCVLSLYPATPVWGVRCGCECLGSGFVCAPPLLAGVLVCAVSCACSPCTPPLLAGVCGVGVCWCARSACPLPLLAGVCGVGVCVSALASTAPRYSWLGCLGVRVDVRAAPVPCHSWLGCVVWLWVFGLGFRLRPATPDWGVRVCVFVCVLPSYPATPGWGVRRACVCLGSGFGCTPPLLAGMLGCVCGPVGAPLVPRHSWLGCAVWVWVFGLGFQLRPATPGWGVGVCVLLCVLRLYPATPGWGVRRGCWCLGSRFGLRSATPGWGVVMCVLVCVLPLYPITHAWVVRHGCACSGSGFDCAPPLLAGVLGCAFAGARAPLVPCHSWLGCAAWVCVFGLGFRLRPATPGWGVGVCLLVCLLSLHPATPGWGVRRGCVCLGSGFGCAPPLLAGVLGCVCAGVRAPPVPRHSWLGCASWVCVLGLRFWLRPATPDWGLWCLGWLFPGTCSCAVVRCVLCVLPGFAAPGGR